MLGPHRPQNCKTHTRSNPRWRRYTNFKLFDRITQPRIVLFCRKSGQCIIGRAGRVIKAQNACRGMGVLKWQCNTNCHLFYVSTFSFFSSAGWVSRPNYGQNLRSMCPFLHHHHHHHQNAGFRVAHNNVNYCWGTLHSQVTCCLRKIV